MENNKKEDILKINNKYKNCKDPLWTASCDIYSLRKQIECLNKTLNNKNELYKNKDKALNIAMGAIEFNLDQATKYGDLKVCNTVIKDMLDSAKEDIDNILGEKSE